MSYSVQQHVQMIKLFYKSGSSVRATFRALVPFYGRLNRPSERTIRNVVNKFEATGSVNTLATPERQRNARSAANIAAVRESVQENPMKSIPCRAQELGLSQTTIWRILRQDLGLHEELKDSNIRDEQRPQIKRLKKDKIALEERRLTKKRIAELDRPKKPPSAFLLFIAKERILSPQSPNETYRDWHSKITAKWAMLPDEQKEVYFQESRLKLETYKKDIVIWEEKMVRLGNIDVVRHEALIDPPTKSKQRLQK